MSLIAAKTSFNMGEGSFVASAIASAVFTTPEAFAPRLGSISYLQFKESEARIHVNTDAIGTVKVMAGAVELASGAFNGETWMAIPVDLTAVQGQTRLQFVVDITTAGTGTGTVQGSIDVEQPAVLRGC